MGTIGFKVDFESTTQAGLKSIMGTVLLPGSYATSGDALNLANYFKSSTEPFVQFGGDAGITLQQTPGRNAESQLILAYNVGWFAINANNGSANQAMTEIGSGTNQATVNSVFMAVGQPY